MFMAERQNSQTSQDSNFLHPNNENEVADIIKKFYKSNIPIEIIGSGSKREIGKTVAYKRLTRLSKSTAKNNE